MGLGHPVRAFQSTSKQRGKSLTGQQVCTHDSGHDSYEFLSKHSHVSHPSTISRAFSICRHPQKKGEERVTSLQKAANWAELQFLGVKFSTLQTVFPNTEIPHPPMQRSSAKCLQGSLPSETFSALRGIARH